MMMIFQRMHLDTGKRNCKFYIHGCVRDVDEVYKYNCSSNLESSKQNQQLTNCTLTFKMRIYMDCYMHKNKYKSWEGLFYHKLKVHNYTDVHSHQYELELKLKSSVKPVNKEAPKCMRCSKNRSALLEGA